MTSKYTKIYVCLLRIGNFNFVKLYRKLLSFLPLQTKQKYASWIDIRSRYFVVGNRTDRKQKYYLVIVIKSNTKYVLIELLQIVTSLY